MDYTITEKEIFKYLDNAKNVLLIEPPYRKQYIPLGLAKIASYIKGRGGKVTYKRKPDGDSYDLICITTLFTTDSAIVKRAIMECKKSLFLQNTPILVGGIFASLMPEWIYKETGVESFFGYSKKLDEQQPDYTIDWDVKPPWDDSALVFTTRGCPNKCGYCMVWRMEPEFYVESSWKKSITENNRKIMVISDNNFLASPIEHIQDVVETCVKYKKNVLFNNAVDVKLLTEEKADLMAKLTYTKDGRPGLRFAFDRMEDDGPYQKACEMMIKKLGKKNLSSVGLSYVLFNFDDTPQEAYYRALECWKYKSVPYLMQYRPLNKLTKKEPFIGKYWTKNLTHAFKVWGQLYGCGTGDGTFISWINSEKSTIKLNDEDWAAWHFKR